MSIGQKKASTCMNAFLNASTIILRICYVAILLLGILLWTGNFDGLKPVHMLIGIVIVLGLWATGVALVMRGGSPGLAGACLVLGLIVLYVGLNQEQWLTGSAHWVIQVVHLALGLATMGLTESTRRRIRVGGVALRRA
jgi:hypothetical protein